MPETVDITELLEIEPDRVDAVGSPANGTEWLILKAVDDSETVADVEGVLAELAKADDDDKRPDCPTCKGTGKIMAGNRKCPDCMGSGVKPQPGDTEKSLMELAAAKESGAAASGADVPVDSVCGHCKGSGQDATGQCDACGGTGKDAAAPSASELNTVDADPGKVTEGAGGRETVDKGVGETFIEIAGTSQHSAQEITEALEKKDVDPNVGGGVDRDKIDAADFAGKNRSFPIVKPGDVSDAASSIGRAGPDNYSADKLKANIIAIAKRKGASFVAELPKAWTAEKAAGDTFTAPNPALANAANQVVAVDPDTTSPLAPPATPGSPAWEAVDAQTATDAALALMTAVELMRTFAQRESTEVAMGEGNDIFDAYAATEAICAAQQALGIIAQLAFHEGLEAAKSLPDDETIEKAGRRLAGKTVAALAAARDKANDLAQHIGGVLGDDDPKKKDASKSADDNSQKDILDMTEDDLQKLVATTVAQAVVAAKSAETELDKGQDVDNTDSIAAGKKTNRNSKKKDPKADNDALEDEATQGTNDSASSPATGAAKAEADEDANEDETDAVKAEAELTPEQIEARDRAKDAKKVAKAAKREEKELAMKVALTKSIEESLKTVVEQNEVLKSTVERLTSDLDGVKKMAAPGNGLVRSAPVEGQNMAKARDEVELRIARLEEEARNTADPAVRSGNREIIKELREQTSDKN